MTKFYVVSFFFFAVTYAVSGFSQNHEIDSLLRKMEQHKTEDSLTAYRLTRLSNYFEVIDLSQAVSYAAKAIRISKEINEPSLLAEAYSQQASNYIWQNNYDSALQLYYSTIDIIQKNNLKNQLSYIYDGLADLYTETGSLDKALKYSRLAMDTSLAQNDTLQLMYALHSISSVYKGLRNYSEAERYIRTALNLFKLYKNKDREATCYMDIARIYIAVNRTADAKALLDSAVTIFKKLDEPIQIAEADELYGEIAVARNNFLDADNYYNSALKIYEQNELGEDKYRVYIGIANQYYLQKKYTKAKSYLTEAVDWFKKNKSDELQLQALLFLIKTDSALGITSNAFLYLKEYKDLSEKIYHYKQELQTRQLLIEYDVANKELENDHLRKQNASAKEFLIVFIIAGILLLFALAITLLLYFQKKEMNSHIVSSKQKTEEINRQLEESNHVKNQLFSILAHDLRSPMSNTLHLLQIARKGEITFEQFRQMGDILESDLVYNNQLLDNMLNWAKNQMEGIVLYKKSLNLYHVVDENIQLFQSIANNKNVEVNCSIPVDMEVYADENILRLALRNSISNALKFSVTGKVIIIRAEEKDDKILLQIKDEGVGISAERLSNLFTYNLNSTMGTQREKGVGLGLKITKEMMDRMLASFWVESKEGAGTTVNILLEKP